MTAITPLISMSNELKGLIESIEYILGKAVNAARRHKVGRAADSLDGLHFAPGGFRRALQNVASGRSTDADLAALDAFHSKTGPAVQEDINSLRGYQNSVRRLCGAKASAKLDELLDGSSGKFVIRYEIEGLANMARDGRCSPADLQQQASRILDLIEQFNRDLIELHDTIFPPAGAPRALI